MLNTFFQGQQKFCSGVPVYGPEHMFEEQSTKRQLKRK